MKKIDKRYENIFEQEKRLKKEAKELVEKHKDVKPIKYDLKR
jgi:acyl-[acyl carrier protein]--UDP-N-acetylglucosamine O-acyltransferase